jgi:hypothetical protein
VLELLQQRLGAAAESDVIADCGCLGAIEHDEIGAAASVERLGRRRARFLVPVFAVNDRGVAVLRISLHVLPDVQHGPAGGIHECAPVPDELLEQLHCGTECRENDDVLRRQPVDRLAWVAEEPDAFRTQLVIDVRVVDDFAGQENLTIGKAMAGLIRVVDRPVDAITEAELAREMHHQTARRELIL